MTSFEEPITTWWVELYAPLPTEFPSSAAWQRAARAPMQDRALRLTKLSYDASTPPGHRLPVAAYRVPLDAVRTHDRPCTICAQPVHLGVSTLGRTFHRRCLRAELPPEVAEELLLVAEELAQLRPWSQVRPSDP